jgi:hypothetical protein
MAKLGNLFVSLIADTAAFSSGLTKAKSDLNSTSAAINAGLAKIDKSFTGLGESVKDMAGEIFSVKGAFTALAGTIGLGSIVELGKQAVETVGSLGEIAQQLGVTTDTLQAFRYAGTQVGISTEEMDGSLGKLTKTIGMAATGNKTAIDSFNQFGIKILDAQGKVRPTDDVIRDIADAIQKLPDPAQRAAAAVDFFGKSGQKMLSFLEDGSQGIDDLVQKAKDLGLVFDQQTIKSADQAADKLATLSLVLKTDLNAALVKLAPLLSDVADKLVAISGSIGTWYQASKNANLPKEIDATTRSIATLQQQIATIKGGGVAGWATALDLGGLDGAEKKLEEQKAKLAGLLGQLPADKGEQGRRGLLPVTGLTVGASNPTPTPTGKSDAEKNIDRMQAKLRDLQNQLDDLNSNDTLNDGVAKNLEGFELKTGQAKELATQIAVVTQEINRAKLADEAFAAQQQADAAAVQQWTAEMDKGRQVADQVRTPIEVYRDRIAELNALHAEGAIDTATWSRALDQSKKTLDDAQTGASEYKSALAGLGATFTSSFEDAALAMNDAGLSAASLGDTLKGLLNDIERIILRLAVEDPVTNWLSKLLSGASSAGINSAGFRSTGAGPGASGNTSVGGGFFDWLVGLFHTGGVAGQSGGAKRSVSALAFVGAPRLHKGGMIGPGEVPAILKAGETVLTPGQMAAMGSGGSTIVANVTINASGGTKDQNADLAAQASKAVKDALRQATRDTIRDETRKGNLLNPSVSV